MKGEILGSVRIGNKVYKAGDEEAFASVASADQIARLKEKGVVSGFGGKSPAESVVEDDAVVIEGKKKGSKAADKS